MPFEFEQGWAKTKLTPETIPRKWVLLQDVFERLLDAIGITSQAVGDLHRMLTTGQLEPNVMRGKYLPRAAQANHLVALGRAIRIESPAQGRR